MAAALVDYARANGIKPKPENVTEFQIFPGEGICGEIHGRCIYIGNKRIAARAGCETGIGIHISFFFKKKKPECSDSNTLKTEFVGPTFHENKVLDLKFHLLIGDGSDYASDWSDIHS